MHIFGGGTSGCRITVGASIWRPELARRDVEEGVPCQSPRAQGLQVYWLGTAATRSRQSWVLKDVLQVWDCTWAVERRALAGRDGVCGSRCLDVVKEAILCTCRSQEVCVQVI